MCPQPLVWPSTIAGVGRRSWVSTRSVSSPRGLSSTVTNVFTLFVSGPVHVNTSLRGRSICTYVPDTSRLDSPDDMTRLKAPPGRRSQLALQSTAPGKGLIHRTIKSGLVHRSKICSAPAFTRRRICTLGPVVSSRAMLAILLAIPGPHLALLLELAQQVLHGVQPLLPIAARPLDPAIGLVQRTGIDGKNVVAPFPVPLDHAARFQHADVFRHRVQGHIEGFGDLGHARLAAREPFDNRPPGRIG